MAAIPLKPEYGPTLGQLLAPRWRAASRAARALVVGACVALLVVALAAALALMNAHYSHGGPVPFSFSYRGLYRSAPEPGQYVKVQRSARGRVEDSFAVGPLVLPRYSGSLSAALPVYAESYIHALRAHYRDFQLSGEGKTRVNTVPAYEIGYTARIEGRTVFGRDILLLPERTHPRAGVRIVMHATPASEAHASTPLEIGATGVLERPVETFSIG